MKLWKIIMSIIAVVISLLSIASVSFCSEGGYYAGGQYGKSNDGWSSFKYLTTVNGIEVYSSFKSLVSYGDYGYKLKLVNSHPFDAQVTWKLKYTCELAQYGITSSDAGGFIRVFGPGENDLENIGNGSCGPARNIKSLDSISVEVSRFSSAGKK